LVTADMIMRRPKQNRSRATIDAVLATTVELLEAGGESSVRLDVVTERSGISTGSIYHHFGDRDGLIAAAQIERFDRLTQEETDGLVRRLDQSLSGTMSRAAFTELLVNEVRGLVQPGRQQLRWARVTALASARTRPTLLAVLADAFSALIDGLAGQSRRAIDVGLLASDTPVRAYAIFSQALSMGLLVNELDADPVSDHEWTSLLERIVRSLIAAAVPDPSAAIDPSILERSVRSSHHAARSAVRRTTAGERTPAARQRSEHNDAESGPIGVSAATEDELVRRMIALAADQLVGLGPNAIRVEQIRLAVGVSAGWFQRAFVDRDGLLDAARIELYERLAADDYARFERAVSQSQDADAFRANLSAALVGLEPTEVLQRSYWQRAELLAATIGRDGIRHALAPIVREATDRMCALVREAQARGLMDRSLEPRAVSRFFESYSFGYLLNELDTGGRLGRRATETDWAKLVITIVDAVLPPEHRLTGPE
jgi:AcrR family transcriptional regulator